MCDENRKYNLDVMKITRGVMKITRGAIKITSVRPHTI
jgi:hypothetical protein